MRIAFIGTATALAVTASMLASGCCGLNTAPPSVASLPATPAVGSYMDRQAQEMNADLSDATVERVGQRIKVTFGSGVLFAPGSADLTADARTSVNRLAVILKKYPDTNVNIEGHTDSDGAEAANQALSERRASAVAAALSDSGVGAARLHPAGYGETQPVATNGTPEGKAANRRVEIIVIAGERLRADMAP